MLLLENNAPCPYMPYTIANVSFNTMVGNLARSRTRPLPYSLPSPRPTLICVYLSGGESNRVSLSTRFVIKIWITPIWKTATTNIRTHSSPSV